MARYRVKMVMLRPLLCGIAALLAATTWVRETRALAEEQKPISPTDFEAIDRRIEEIQPTAKERRFDAIGWAKGLLEAERLAKESGRPVFLFCNVGQLGIGRC